ncbi:DUF7522 family protein [Halalkalicoccus ordinarius]|uniref:DUF7522 family protein n=1 Tax=Halalkalicoccus ordinarius TaxID=3116651 RepID=UPI00300F274A
MDDRIIDTELADELISVCRTVVGDELRSITYFDEERVEQLYRRSDLDRTADLVGFAEQERAGFRSQSAYRNTQLGEYQATVRMFERGFLTRVIEGEHGVWVTTDDISIDRFEELSTALKSVLGDVVDSIEAA